MPESWWNFLLFGILQVSQSGSRVTRRALKKLNGSFESVQSEKATSNKRKSTSKKRKAQDSSSYMISEYLDKEVTLIKWLMYFPLLLKLIKLLDCVCGWQMNLLNTNIGCMYTWHILKKIDFISTWTLLNTSALIKWLISIFPSLSHGNNLQFESGFYRASFSNCLSDGQSEQGFGL